LIKINEVLEVIANRRSVRQFKDEQIKDDELKAILDAGLKAPSGHNDQSWYFTVIQNKETLKEISDGSKAEMRESSITWMAEVGKNEKLNIFYNASTAIIISARKEAVSPIADVCAAIENMMIAAESLNIGSCWIGFAKFFFKDITSYKRLDIPEGYEVHYAIVLGYKPVGYKMIPPARKFSKYYTIIK
jgi:nitroreductase